MNSSDFQGIRVMVQQIAASKDTLSDISAHYQIDARDRLIFFDDAYRSFAESNRAESLATSSALYRSIWDFISDSTTIYLYRMLFDKVRHSGKPVSVPLRCDSPDVCRKVILDIESLGEDNLDLNVRTRWIKPRSFDYFSEFADGKTPAVVCGFCNKAQTKEGEWVHLDDFLRKTGDLAFEPEYRCCESCQHEVLSILGAFDKDRSCVA